MDLGLGCSVDLLQISVCGFRFRLYVDLRQGSECGSRLSGSPPRKFVWI